ncbi:hypothetical protein ACP70R_023008 [Stipagrostis hirtigluma subsp. patula]
MAPRSSSSAATRSVRRELQRRQPKKPLAATTRPAAKKPSAAPSRSARDADRPRARPPRVEPSSTTARPRGSASTGAPAPPLPRPRLPLFPQASSYSSSLGPGTAVLVRTRVSTLPTGQTLVLWLGAEVVSANVDGDYVVVYNGDWPRGNPHAPVHVARHHVKLPPPPQSKPTSSAASSCTSPTTAVTAAPKKEMQPAPRPTTAGKSVRLIRKLWPEMELQNRE